MSTPARIYAGAAAAVAALVALLALAAHIESVSAADSPLTVISIAPADGAVLTTVPTAVQIRVSARPDVELSHISVYDGASSRRDTGAIRPDGDDGLRQAIALDGPAAIAVAYHVVSLDGRVVSGIVRFTVGATDGSVDPPPTAHAHSVDPIGAALLIVDGVALLIVLLLLFRRRSGTTRS
ncbi:copper resistance protein CopC [Micromonospora sp. NPDC049900]|uniref:copper resistance protein CopC n=1 Tax=Micromonospora sp. NPDC049900 TaxID=3364275 RepID=UPI00378C6951